MGKVLVIKNADFSDNAIMQIDLPTPPTPIVHNYIQLDIDGLDASTYRAVYNNVITVGKKVGFADPSMWTKYKMAIGLGPELWPRGTPTWDTQYGGQSYITNNVTILTRAVQIMIAPIDGSGLTIEQLAEINDNAFYIDN